MLHARLGSRTGRVVVLGPPRQPTALWTGGQMYRQRVLDAASRDSRFELRELRYRTTFAWPPIHRYIVGSMAALVAWARQRPPRGSVLWVDYSERWHLLPLALLGRLTGLLQPVVFAQALSFYRRSRLVNLLDRAVTWLLLRAAKRVVGVAHMQRHLLRRLGARPADVRIVVPATEGLGMEPLPRRPRSPSGPVRLLFVGRASPQKGLEYLVAALAQLRALRWHLDLVGDLTVEAGYTDALRQQIAAAGLADRIALRGLVADRQRLAEAYLAADVFVLPSLEEGTPLVLAEAMGCGLPVVASRVGGTPEVVRDGEEGLLVPARDVAALAQALSRLIEDGELRERMGRRALARARQLRRTWEDVTREWLDILAELAAAAPQPGLAAERDGAAAAH